MLLGETLLYFIKISDIHSNNLIYLGKFENASDISKLSNMKGDFDIHIEKAN